MGNLKTFMNIGFVVLCLVMLWYLFTYNTKGRDVRTQYQAPNRSTYNEEDFGGNREREYGDTRYTEPNRSSNVYEEPIEEKPSKRFWERGKSDEQKAREREAELERIRQEEQSYQRQPSSAGSNSRNYTRPESENPFDRQDTYNTPLPERNTQAPERVYGGLRYGSKRFSRDNQLGTYKGPLLNGQPHGFGFIEYDNKNIYVGEYQNGKRHGFGNSIYRIGKTGNVKLRQYSKGRQLDSSPVNSVSYGNMRFVNGGTKGTYYGPMRNQEPHGFGYFKYDNGNIYIGGYKNGQRHGAGNMVYADKSIETMKYEYGRAL